MRPTIFKKIAKKISYGLSETQKNEKIYRVFQKFVQKFARVVEKIVRNHNYSGKHGR